MRKGQQQRSIGIAVALLAMAGAGSPAQPAPPTVNVPFVGCASDGQQGPLPAPKPSKPTPRLPAAIAGRLAYYAGAYNGVLAPRGWHCFSLYGSSGATVLVTPEPIDAKRAFDPKFKLTGSAVVFGYTFGGTSGRFAVAQISARLFPIAHGLVDRVVKEQKDEGIPFPISRKPYPADRMVSRTDTVVRLVTAAGREGLGTQSPLAPNSSPIDSMAMIIEGDFDLIRLNVRLPKGDRELVSAIQSVTEANHGDPLSDQ